MGLEYTPYTPYKRYKLEISYDGSDYCGWQIQPHSPSVQQTLQETLEKQLRNFSPNKTSQKNNCSPG